LHQENSGSQIRRCFEGNQEERGKKRLNKIWQLYHAKKNVSVSKSTSLSYRTDTEFFHIVIWFKLGWVSVTVPVSCVRHMGSLMKKSCFLSLIGENGGGISSCVTFLIVAFPYSGHFSINVILSWGNDLWLVRRWLCCDWSMNCSLCSLLWPNSITNIQKHAKICNVHWTTCYMMSRVKVACK